MTAGEERKGLEKETIDKIKDNLGDFGKRGAIVLGAFNETDRKNAIADMAEQQSAKRSDAKKIISAIPIAGAIYKAVQTWGYIKKAKKAIKETGSLKGAYDELELKQTKALDSSEGETIIDRAWQTLEDNTVDGTLVDKEGKETTIVTSELDDKETVEKLEKEEEASKQVREALNEFYSKLKAAESDEDKEKAEEAFDRAVGNINIANKDTLSSESLKEAKEGIERLISAEDIEEKDFKIYLENHVTFYRASMKEGIYTKQKVDTITSAIMRAGLAGGIAVAVIAPVSRRILRTVGGGAIVGAAFGGARGYQKAKAKLSKAEIEAIGKIKSGEEPEEETEEDDSGHEDDAETSPSEGEEGEEGKEGEKDKEDSPESSNQNLFKKILKKLEQYNAFKGKITKEEDLLAKIEEKRERKKASDIMDDIYGIFEKYEIPKDDSGNLKILSGLDENDTNALIKIYAEAIARGHLSSEKNIDLIVFDKDEDGDGTRMLLEQDLVYTRKTLLKNGKTFDDIKEAITNAEENLRNNYDEARKEEKKLIIRTMAVEAIQGAIIGAGVGKLFSMVFSDAGVSPEELNHLGTSAAELEEDPNGGFAVKVGGEEIIGQGDDPGIEYDDNGRLTPNSLERLKEVCTDVKEKSTAVSINSAQKDIDIQEFFNPANKEANNLTEVTSRSWITDNNGNNLVDYDNVYMDGDGNTVVQISSRQGSNIDIADMKMLFTPGDGNSSTGIALDVNPDGTVIIPADSPIASMFDGDSYQGGYAELIHEGTDGHVDVYSTIGDGHPDIHEITTTGSSSYTIYDYDLTYEGETYSMETPDSVKDGIRLNAEAGVASLKGTGEPINYEPTGETTNLSTSSGETVEVEQLRHSGGYSDTEDTYFHYDDKEIANGSTESVVRNMLGNEANNLSNQEASQLFLDKINSGEIAEGDVVEEYLKTIGNSPESIVTTRAMLGGFEFEINGETVLIDTQDKINIVSDIISRDPEYYDQFVNETFDLFHEKIEGGQIRFIDYSKEQYQYTSWGVLGDENNVMQRLGTKSSQSYGIGMTFTDKNGNSIYDEATVRNIWHLPSNYHIEYVADRLNCGQKTARGDFANISTTASTTTPVGSSGQPGTPGTSTFVPPTDDDTTIPTSDDTTTDDETIIKPWGKSGDPHSGANRLPSDQVDPNSEVTEAVNDATNAGNQGYIDDNGATPGSSSDVNGTNESGYASSGITAEGATNDGTRLTGGENQGGTTIAGQNPNYTDTTGTGVAFDASGNASQAAANTSGSTAGGNNYSDKTEEEIVNGGNF